MKNKSKKQAEKLDISSNKLLLSGVSGSAFTVTLPNVVLDCGNAKIVFDKQQIQVDDMLDVYIKLKNYLNIFNGVYL